MRTNTTNVHLWLIYRKETKAQGRSPVVQGEPQGKLVCVIREANSSSCQLSLFLL